MKAAEALKGLDLDGGWHVDERVERSTKGTGGYSSISYFASNKEGEKGFLKALDFSSAMQAMALAKVKAGELDALRVSARKIA